jgi:hypothetical protein
VALEQLLEQQKLGVQMLLLWRLVNNGDAAQRPFMTRQRPFIAEHRHDALLQRIGPGRRWQHLLDCRAAGALRPRQHGVEHGAAGVGVDLYQSKAALGDVKVVAEENAFGAAGVMPRNGGRLRQHFFTVSRHGDDGLDGLHQLSHARRVGLRQKPAARRTDTGSAHVSVQTGRAGQFPIAMPGAARRRLGSRKSIRC